MEQAVNFLHSELNISVLSIEKAVNFLHKELNMSVLSMDWAVNFFHSELNISVLSMEQALISDSFLFDIIYYFKLFQDRIHEPGPSTSSVCDTVDSIEIKEPSDAIIGMGDIDCKQETSDSIDAIKNIYIKEETMDMVRTWRIRLGC